MNSWQDIVLTIGQFVFFISLIPTIKAKEKPPLSTCIPTAFVLTVYIPTLWSLNLAISVFSTVLVAISWWILTFQKYAQTKEASRQ